MAKKGASLGRTKVYIASMRKMTVIMSAME